MISMPSMKQLSKDKTMIFSFLLVVLGSLYSNFSYLQAVLSPKVYGISFVVIGCICAALRFTANKPLQST